MRFLPAAVFGLILLLTASAGAVAQERQLGVKAGVNFASLQFEDDAAGSYDERRLGLLGGGFAVVPLTPRFAFQFEALFAQKGGKVTPEEDLHAVLEVDYLDFPVLARIAGPATGVTRFFVFGGPSFSYRMGAKSRLTYTGFDFASGEVNNIEDDIKRFDLGLVAGIGADIGRRLTVDARYSWGLANIDKAAGSGEAIKHRVLSLLAGIRF